MCILCIDIYILHLKTGLVCASTPLSHSHFICCTLTATDPQSRFPHILGGCYKHPVEQTNQCGKPQKQTYHLGMVYFIRAMKMVILRMVYLLGFATLTTIKNRILYRLLLHYMLYHTSVHSRIECPEQYYHMNPYYMKTI